MAKYGAFVYRGSYYGEIPRLPFSVEPFQAVAVDYDKVILSWGTPQGAVNGLRLVRNQTGFGEWPEDGIVLFEYNNEQTEFSLNLFVDGIDNLEDDDTENDIPLIPGRFVYYRMWVRRTDTNLWTPAESVVVVLPREHGTLGPDGQTFISTHDSVMDLLPRVYTSASQTPLDPVDPDSDLYKFLESFSFTVDEFLTLADLLLPDFSGKSTNPALLDLQTAELGLTLEDTEFVIRQKRMVREALYIYARKGTAAGLGTLVESLTGFAPEITSSKNLLLSNQDSTFNNSLGNWKTVGNVTLGLTSETRPPSGEDFAIEADYSAKITVGTAGAKLTNGLDSPITKGIPVTAGTSYTFSYYTQTTAAGDSVTVVPAINWHNSAGAIIQTAVGSGTASTVSWAKNSFTAVAPGKDYVVSSYVISSNVVTLTTTETHSITNGATIQVANLGIPLDGVQTVTAVGSNTISFALTAPDGSETGLNGVVSVQESVYATVELRFTDTGGCYLDLVQFADSSVTDYFEARGLNIFLNPSKSNYINNPSFSGITEQWTFTGATGTYVSTTTPYVYGGDTMLSLDTTSGVAWSVSDVTDTGGMPVGDYYSFSVYAQAPAGDETLALEFVVTDSVNPTLTFTSDPITVSDDWRRISVNGYVPANYASDTMFVTVRIKSAGTVGGNVINFEAAQLEDSFAPTLYIDGSFPAEYGVVWEGTADNSRSHLYKNKQQKIIRLIQELEYFLPSNTPYVVESFGGIETAAITY